MSENQVVEFEEYYPPHNRWYSLRCYPSAEGLSVYFTDITDAVARRSAEEALQSRERVVSLATLATGLAHEIKNPLAALMTAAQAAQNVKDGQDTDDTPRDVNDLTWCLNSTPRICLGFRKPAEAFPHKSRCCT